MEGCALVPSLRVIPIEESINNKKDIARRICQPSSNLIQSSSEPSTSGFDKDLM
jgi:hypothetical protein